MSTPTAGLLDTSVFIARETQRTLSELPQRVAVSVITIGELQQRTIKLTDALIAATAVEHGLPVVTQDHDYDQIKRAHPALQVLNV